jgi:hypothetical protein
MCLGRTTSQLHSKFVIDGRNVFIAKQTGVYLRNMADNFNDEVKCKHLLFPTMSPKWLLLVAFLSVKVHKYIWTWSRMNCATFHNYQYNQVTHTEQIRPSTTNILLKEKAQCEFEYYIDAFCLLPFKGTQPGQWQYIEMKYHWNLTDLRFSIFWDVNVMWCKKTVIFIYF